jgi:hypothetical protein
LTWFAPFYGSYKDDGLSGGSESIVTREEGKVIVILANPTLIVGISPDRRRIKIPQHDIAAVATNEIVATDARNFLVLF